jgi:DNA modification methylase
MIMSMATQAIVMNQVVAVSGLRPHPQNYNRHDSSQVADLRASLRKFGQVRSIVVQADAADGHLIVAGHGVVAAAQAAGLTTLRADVIPADWPPAKVLAYLAADNELARRANPDQAQLAALVQQVQQVDAELAALAAGSEARLAELLASVNQGTREDPGPQIDKAVELQAKWGVQAGDLWQLGEHRLICGDCTDREVVERVMGEKKASLVITDPPYGVEYADKNKFLNAVAKGYRIQTEIEGDHSTKEDTQALWKAAFAQMDRIMLPGGVVYCFMPQGGDQMMMMMMMMGAGIKPRHELIWLKNNHVLGRTDYAYKHEPILYAWKAGGHKFYGDFQTSILEFPKPQQSNLHPTTKPVELIERLMTNSSIAGELVFDPFLGSGTTIIACERLGRRCRAVEIVPQYVAVALERWATMTGKTPVRMAAGDGQHG